MLPRSVPLLKHQLKLSIQFQLEPKIGQFRLEKSVEDQEQQEAAEFVEWEFEYYGGWGGQ
jgi:hypothetical protein